jgi:Mg2+ and Co2+ transporter CorA
LSGEVAGDETDDEYSLKEDDLTALAEELSVDVTPVKSGWRDNSTLKTQDNVTAYLAHEQDDKVKEEREKMEKAIEELKESLKVSEEKKNKTLKENKEIKELLSKVKTLLENTNISNAKLLYTNKALTNSSLNERQKKNIAESLKKASSVENAKVIYEASLNSMQAGSIKTSPQSLNEAVSRPSTSSLVLNRGGNQNQNLKNTTSVSPQVERMQKLAGIRVGNNNTSGTK